MENGQKDNGLGLTDDLSQGGFFTDLENTKPFMKVAFEGFAGSGKTYTAVQLAIGLHARIGSTKPIIYFDTEKAGKFLRQMFQEAGIKVLHKESRSMADLAQTMRLMREEGVGDVLIIDSISHLWESFLLAYKEKTKKDRLEFQDWGIIKPTWKSQFSDPLVRDPYHILFTGRAGYEYSDEKDDRGKRQIYKSGVKMKVEGETAYEPDLLVLMERFEEVVDTDNKRVWREATIIKDRSTLIDGKTFKNPTVNDFMPAIDRCLAEPVRRAAVIEGNTAALFKTEEDQREWVRRKTIALEEIEGVLVKYFPGQKADEKKAKGDALEAVFQTRSWEKVKIAKLEALEQGVSALDTWCSARLAKATEGGAREPGADG